jgi:hypothetical protein
VVALGVISHNAPGRWAYRDRYSGLAETTGTAASNVTPRHCACKTAIAETENFVGCSGEAWFLTLCTTMTSTYGHNEFSVDGSFWPADTFANSQFGIIRRERQAALKL